MYEEDSPVGMIRIGQPPAAAPQRKPTRRRYVLLGGLGVVVLAIGAATAGILVAVARGDSGSAVAGPTQSPSAAVQSQADPAGVEACRLVKEAALTDQLMVPETVAAILQQAKSSQSFKVKFHAQMLHDQQEIAIAGGKDHPAYVLDLHSEALEMQTDCVTEGLSD